MTKKNSVDRKVDTRTQTEVLEDPARVPEYDLIIIGAGPAGMSAGIYAVRARMNFLLLEGKMPGGLMSTTDKIENYPGCVEPLSGMELSEHMEKQLQRFGVKYEWAYIDQLQKIEDKFILRTDENKMFIARTVIVATGCTPKKLHIPGEEEFRGRGVSYCATCDGPFYKDKTVVVVGGGDSAVKEALYLRRFAKKIYIVHRRGSLRAEKIVAEEAMNDRQIEFVWDSTVEAIKGEGGVVTQVSVKNVSSGNTRDIFTDGVFIYVGYKPKSKFLDNLVKKDELGFVIADEDMRTTTPGLFAAGDVRAKSFRQVVTAVADGAIAVNSADEYLNELITSQSQGRSTHNLY
jgi:thioredoxin reductase (NADPH)